MRAWKKWGIIIRRSSKFSLEFAWMIEGIQLGQGPVCGRFGLSAAWSLDFLLCGRALNRYFFLVAQLRSINSWKGLFFLTKDDLSFDVFRIGGVFQHGVLFQMGVGLGKGLVGEVEGIVGHLVHLIVVHLLVVVVYLLLGPIWLMAVVEFVLLGQLFLPLLASFVGVGAFITQFALSCMIKRYTFSVELAKDGLVVFGLAFLCDFFCLASDDLLVVLG